MVSFPGVLRVHKDPQVADQATRVRAATQNRPKEGRCGDTLQSSKHNGGGAERGVQKASADPYQDTCCAPMQLRPPDYRCIERCCLWVQQPSRCRWSPKQHGWPSCKAHHHLFGSLYPPQGLFCPHTFGSNIYPKHRQSTAYQPHQLDCYWKEFCHQAGERRRSREDIGFHPAAARPLEKVDRDGGGNKKRGRQQRTKGAATDGRGLAVRFVTRMDWKSSKAAQLNRAGLIRFDTLP